MSSEPDGMFDITSYTIPEVATGNWIYSMEPYKGSCPLPGEYEYIVYYTHPLSVGTETLSFIVHSSMSWAKNPITVWDYYELACPGWTIVRVCRI